MGMIADMRRLFRISTKPDRREIWLVIRVTAFGMGFLGFIGFIIKVASDTIIGAIT